MFSLLRAFSTQQTSRSSTKLWPIRHSSWDQASRPETSEADLEAARQWRSSFHQSSIDRRPGIITTSRSSGPGGQHVNTTDSKVTLKYPEQDLLRQIPTVLHEKIRGLKYYKKAGFLSIQVSEHRKQAQNEDEAWLRLYHEISNLAKSIPGATSVAQKEKVQELERRGKLARKKMKMEHSSKKRGRRSGRFED